MARHTILVIPLLATLLLFVAHTCYACKWQEQRSCAKQLKRVNLKPCMKHIMEQIQPEEEENVLLKRGSINLIRWKNEDNDEDHEQMCCSEMSELNSPQCQCRALQKIMQKQGEKLEKKEKLQMASELMKLSMRCGFGPLMECDLRCEE
ncbi:2S albumin-like [Abrus precatorius]|uniref:2S albumin-like n=1 Tax=Abrus precatorius TaxID=3816 RepID=A0A8B8KIT9_ABRPR|nr:2S albumin-like [Abrus precatorius]